MPLSDIAWTPFENLLCHLVLYADSLAPASEPAKPCMRSRRTLVSLGLAEPVRVGRSCLPLNSAASVPAQRNVAQATVISAVITTRTAADSTWGLIGVLSHCSGDVISGAFDRKARRGVY